MWGDPIELFGEDTTLARVEALKTRGIEQGKLIQYGTPANGGMFMWERPEASAMNHQVCVAAFGMILAIDIESDPSIDWLMIYISTSKNGESLTRIGWVPAVLVTVL